MRYLRSSVQNAINDTDLERVAMEMVNLHHRTLYWDPVTGKKVDNPQTGYMRCSVNNMDYELFMPRGYIHIGMKSTHTLLTINLTMRQLVQRLFALFNHFNEWPNPKTWYTYTNINHTKLSSVHFNLMETEVPVATKTVVVTDAEPGTTHKTRTSPVYMTWHVSTNRNAVRYSVPGDYPPENVLLQAPTMIVLDTSWDIMVDHGYRSLNYPPVPKHISVHLDPPVAINSKIGILVHLYNRIVAPDSKPHPHAFRYYSVEVARAEVHKDIHVSYAHAEVLMRPTKPNQCRPHYCSVCRFPLFQHYYVAEKALRAAVCVVCAHFNHAVNLQMKDMTVSAVVHPVTTTDYIGTLGLPRLEEEILLQLHRGMQSNSVKSYNEQDPLIRSLNFSYNKEVLRCDNLLGVENNLDIVDAINDSHLIPAGTVLFKFELW